MQCAFRIPYAFCLVILCVILLCACTETVCPVPPENTAVPSSEDTAPGTVAVPGETTGLEESMPQQTSCPEKEQPVPAEEDYQTITLSFLGDCMLAGYMGYDSPGTFNYFAKDQDPSYFFARIAEVIACDDYTIGNLENVFTDQPLLPVSKDHSPAYWYKSPSSFAQILKAGSVEIVSIANNHSGDYGAQGYADTKAALEAAGIVWGDSSHAVTLELHGVRIAILCTTISTGGYCDMARAWIREAVEESDYQIIYFHGGVNFSRTPNAAIVRACHDLADAGADLIVGHHPHLLQPVEQYGDVLIMPSIGSCVFGHGTMENAGVILQLQLTVKEGQIVNSVSSLIPIYIYQEPWQPAVMDADAGQKVLDFLNGTRSLPY